MNNLPLRQRLTSYFRNVFARPTLGQHTKIGPHVTVRAKVSIGDYSYVNSGSFIASGVIGKFCSISYNCQIGLDEHPIGFLSTSPLTYGRKNIFGMPSRWSQQAAAPVIGNDVWIGVEAIILRGVTIGDGAIIAAGAVVHRDVPPYAIVGGVPAKLLKYRFTAEQIEYLLTLRWWDMPIEELQQYREAFLSGEDWFAVLAQTNATAEEIRSGEVRGG